MKYRNGFVSNSSSSSFVVNNGMTTAQIATLMLYGILDSWLRNPGMYNNEVNTDVSFSPWQNKMLSAIEWLEENQDFDEPVVFPWTTNEETFIWHHKLLGTCVHTCNNQAQYWHILGPDYDPADSNEFYESRNTESFFDLDTKEYYTRKQYMDKIYADFRGKAT